MRPIRIVIQKALHFVSESDHHTFDWVHHIVAKSGQIKTI